MDIKTEAGVLNQRTHEEGDYHIEATESLVARVLRTLKHDDLFAVFDQQGDFKAGSSGPDGLYYRDTRYLNHLQLLLGGIEPLQLGSVLLDDNVAMVVDATNADLHSTTGSTWLQRESIHVQRFKFLHANTSFERIRLRSFGPIGRAVPLELRFASDFADLFEVRGERRLKRGTSRAVLRDDQSVDLVYQGLDGRVRSTRLHFDPIPEELTTSLAKWSIDLDACDGERRILVRVECSAEEGEFRNLEAPRAFRQTCKSRQKQHAERAAIGTNSAQFDQLLARAWSDLDMLISETEWGPYPYAGVPWYSTVFGRDGIITAMQMLWCAPYIARGVLTTLAALQATTEDPVADAQPGKIVHEMREGEMALLGEVPFRRYYGTVDATPLFVMLAGQYLERTGDLEFIRGLWPNILAALEWMDRYGDIDGDGFLEYARMTSTGLANQGWKDSHDSIFHSDGRLATGPIALIEVQAYAFAAKQLAAQMAMALGDTEASERWHEEAERIREKVETEFWIEDLGTYALALDGNKEPCRVASSNAGHVLFCGLAKPERARRVADQLMSSEFFTGWGIRTIPSSGARYNPMSYHNGSVWPHDNSLIALGFARYGFKEEINRLFKGIIDAAGYNDLRRLPELFCGFRRRRDQAPTGYPVACSPQAWAAGTIFAFLAASCGVKISASDNVLELDRPSLPAALRNLSISRLKLGTACVSLNIARVGEDVTAVVRDRSDDAHLIIRK